MTLTSWAAGTGMAGSSAWQAAASELPLPPVRQFQLLAAAADLQWEPLSKGCRQLAPLQHQLHPCKQQSGVSSIGAPNFLALAGVRGG